jgi:hypothetical protein
MKAGVSLNRLGAGIKSFSAHLRPSHLPLAGCLLVATPLLSPAAAGRDTTNATEPTVASYLRQVGYERVRIKETKKHQLRVEVSLRDRKYTFAVNSGTPLSTISEKIAKPFKTLEQAGVVLEDDLLGRLTNSDLVLLEKLTLNRSQFFNQPAKVEKFHADEMVVDFDGVLGLDFLLRNHCLIDCGEPALYVRGNRPSTETMAAMAATFRKSHFDEVAMRVGAVPFVAAHIRNRTILMEVSTGVNFTALDRGVASDLGLPIPVEGKIRRWSLKPGSLFVTGTGDMGVRAAEGSRLIGLSIGERTWDYAFVLVVDLGFDGRPQRSPGKAVIEGVLGTDMLINNGTLMDFEARRLWFIPLSQEQLNTLKWAAEVWQTNINRMKTNDAASRKREKRVAP